jgi:hypothetical protein
MLNRLLRISAVPALLATTLLVAACGSSSSSTTSSSTASTAATSTAAAAPVGVVGKSTSVVLNPATAAALKQAEITVTPVAPATAKTVLVFPVTGGHVVVTSLAGTIDHSGGLTFSHAGKSVTLTSFIVNTETKQLTATAGGQSLPVFDLSLASIKRASGPNGTVIASNIGLNLTEQAASALNCGLGVSTFKAGLNFGIATLTVAVG